LKILMINCQANKYPEFCALVCRYSILEHLDFKSGDDFCLPLVDCIDSYFIGHYMSPIKGSFGNSASLQSLRAYFQTMDSDSSIPPEQRFPNDLEIPLLIKDLVLKTREAKVRKYNSRSELQD